MIFNKKRIVSIQYLREEAAANVYKAIAANCELAFIFNVLKKIVRETGEKSKARKLLWCGGVRSLKTSSLLQLMGWHATGYYPGDSGTGGYVYDGYRFNRPVKIMVVTHRWENMRDPIQPYLFDFTSGGRRPDILFVTENSIKMKQNVQDVISRVSTPHFTNGKFDGSSTIVFKSYTEGWQAFRSTTFDLILFDEEPDNFRIFIECCNRLTSMTIDADVQGKDDEKHEAARTQIFVAMCPQKGRTELVNYFFKNDKDVTVDGVYYTTSGWNDNPFLDDKEIKDMEKTYPKYMIPCLRDGTPLFGVGKVFPFDVRQEMVCDSFEVPDYWRWIVGIDPAATSHGTWGGCVLAWDCDTDTVYLVREYLKTGLTLVEHSDNIVKRLLPFSKVPIICDYAGGGEDSETRLSAMNYLKQRIRLNIYEAEKVNKAKEVAVDTILERHRQGRFVIFNTCESALSQFNEYVRGEDGKIMKKNDHIIDACFYALNKLTLAQSKNVAYYNCGWSSDIVAPPRYLG